MSKAKVKEYILKLPDKIVLENKFREITMLNERSEEEIG